MEDLGVDGRIILKINVQGVGRGGTDCTYLAQVRDGWRTVMDAIMNLRVRQNVGNFSTR
jgi:hypothetical protein